MEKKKFDIMNVFSWIKVHKSSIIQYGGLVLVLLVFGILTNGNIFSKYNLKNLVGQVTPLLIMAVGMMFIFSHGSMDVANGAVGGLCALIILEIINKTGNVWLGIVVAILLSLALYALMCLTTVKFGLMSTISSLAIMFISRGIITYICSKHDGVVKLNDYQLIANFKNNWVMQLIVSIVVVLIGTILFNFTKIGKQSKAIGDNQLSAKQSGTKVDFIKMICFLIGGLCVGLASVFILARAGQVGKNIGSGYEMDIMVAIILGGMALSGGAKSRMSAAVIGSITFRLLSNGMTMAGVPSGYISLVKGIIFVIIVFITLRQNKNIKEMPR